MYPSGNGASGSGSPHPHAHAHGSPHSHVAHSNGNHSNGTNGDKKPHGFVSVRERDLDYLSLPAQDSRAYYSDTDSEPDSPIADIKPHFRTNRGFKLHPRAKYVRSGRLGFHARAEAEDVLAPPAIAAANLRRTRRAMHGPPFRVAPGFVLADEAALTLAPAAPTLPPHPKTPVDMLHYAPVMEVLGGRNRVFFDLAAETTAIIEQENPFLRALARTAGHLRGENFHFRIGDALDREQEAARRQRELAAAAGATPSHDVLLDYVRHPARYTRDASAENGAEATAENGGAGDVGRKHARESTSPAASASPKRQRTDSDDEAEPRRSGRVASRVVNRSQSDDEDEIEFGTKFEKLPPHVEKLLNPETFVRSLFVSAEDVQLEHTDGATRTLRTYTPKEQEELLEECTGTLGNLLQDTQEYLLRLGQVRDAVLDVNRRKKGMYEVVRLLAEDYLGSVLE